MVRYYFFNLKIFEMDKLKSIFLISTLLIIALKSFAQENQDFEIEYVYNKDGLAFFDRIDFKNTSTGKIINSFDPLKNNPYNHLDFPVFKIDAFGCKIYDLSKVKKENYPDLLEKIQMPAYTRNHELAGARSRVYVYYKGKHYTLVSYSLSIITRGGKFWAPSRS